MNRQFVAAVAAMVAAAFPTIGAAVPAAATTSHTGTAAIAVPVGERPESRLVVREEGARGTAPSEWTLTCDPAGGSHPDPRAACETLAHADDPFAPTPESAMCTQQHGGAQQAQITGIWRGTWVSARYSRRNGCEIARWNRIAAVLSPNGAGVA